MPTLNVYAVVILVALVAFWLVENLARWLDLRAFATRVPDELDGVLERDELVRGRRYAAARARLAATRSSVELAVLLAFWWAGGFAWLDAATRRWSEAWLGSHPLATGALFVGVLVVAQLVLGLPFRLWSTFGIEERFGFNRTTPRTFVLDLIKGLLVAVVLGLPLLLGVLAFFEYGGRWAWLWAWLAASAFLVVVQYVVPTWILPLFHRFEPLEEGELRRRLFEVAERAGFPVQEIFVIDGSRRSSKGNAFFTGFGKRKRIALFDTLVDKHGREELAAVLAHEIGHYRLGHVRIGLVLGIAHLGLDLWLLSIFLEHGGLFDAFGLAASTWGGLVLFGLLIAPLEGLLGLLLNALSRRHEYQADRFARRTMGEAESLATALRRLSVDHLANPTPHPLRVVLDYSHPPLLRRLRELRGGDAG